MLTNGIPARFNYCVKNKFCFGFLSANVKCLSSVCKCTHVLAHPFHWHLLPPAHKPIKRYAEPWKSLINRLNLDLVFYKILNVFTLFFFLVYYFQKHLPHTKNKRRKPKFHQHVPMFFFVEPFTFYLSLEEPSTPTSVH